MLTEKINNNKFKKKELTLLLEYSKSRKIKIK
jgi:hypothetical protein